MSLKNNLLQLYYQTRWQMDNMFQTDAPSGVLTSIISGLSRSIYQVFFWLILAGDLNWGLYLFGQWMLSSVHGTHMLAANVVFNILMIFKKVHFPNRFKKFEAFLYTAMLVVSLYFWLIQCVDEELLYGILFSGSFSIIVTLLIMYGIKLAYKEYATIELLTFWTIYQLTAYTIYLAIMGQSTFTVDYFVLVVVAIFSLLITAIEVRLLGDLMNK